MTAGRSTYFRWASGLAIGLLVAGVGLAAALAATYREQDAGFPILFFAMIYVGIAVPVCFASAVLAGLSLSKGEGRRNGALVLLIATGSVVWIFKWVPFQFAQKLVETFLQ